MSFLVEDFVNRQELLATLWKIIRHETDQRLLFIHGPDGIGKTYLLDEFRAECQVDKIEYVRLDFVEIPNPNYLTVVLSVYGQLGPPGFEHLSQTIDETRSLGAWETIDSQTGQGDGGDEIGIYVRDIGPDAQVIGKQVINLTQIIQRDDPVTQQKIQIDVTRALQDCLAEFTTTHTVVFLFDSWHKATTDIRDWLSENLLRWIADEKLPKGAAVVAGREVPDMHRPRRRIGRLALAELPDEAVRTYWVEKYGLPPDEVPDIIKYSGGMPIVMFMMAERRAMALGISS
jgi:hypothetical protein